MQQSPAYVSDEDSHVAHAYLLAVLARNDIEVESLPATFISRLWEITRRESASDLLLDAARQARGESWRSDIDHSVLLSEDDKSAWSDILSAHRTEIRQLLFELAENYFLIVAIPAGDHSAPSTAIVKYRRIDERRPTIAPWHAAVVSAIGWAPSRILCPAPGIGTAERTHTRVVAPDGVTIRDVRLLQGDEGQPVEDEFYQKRLDPSRGVIYTRFRRRGLYWVDVSLRPRRGGFLGPALLSTGALALLFILALLLETFGQRLSDKNMSVDAAVAVIALIPSLLAVELVRRDEHRVVGEMLRLPRIAVVLTVICAVLLAGTVASGLGSTAIIIAAWVAASVATLTSAYLGVLNFRGRHAPTRA